MAASNLPTSRNFKFESFPGAAPWFSNFLQALNLFVEPVYQILDGGVNYQNLTIPQIVTRAITAPASGSVTFSFTNPLAIAPSAILLGNIYQSGNPSIHPSSPSVVYWHYSQGTIYIDNLTNLTASTSYIVTLVVL